MNHMIEVYEEVGHIICEDEKVGVLLLMSIIESHVKKK